MKSLSVFKNSRLITSILSLGGFQLVNLIIPILLVPLLIRKLGLEGYGILILSHTVLAYISIVVDFGFNLSTTREIAVNQADHHYTNQIFSSVLFIKMIFATVSFLLLVLSLIFIGTSKETLLLYIAGFGVVLGNAIFPLWLFQGLEKMGYILKANILSKCILVAVVAFYVDDQNDLIVAGLAYGVSQLIYGMLGIVVSLYTGLAKFTGTTWETVKTLIAESFGYFISRLAVSVYTLSNVTVLGVVLGPVAVANYSIAERLYQAVRRIYQVLGSALYPYISVKKDTILFRKIFILAVFGNVFVVASVIALARPICIFLMGVEDLLSLDMAVRNLRLLSVGSLIVLPSIMLGYPLLGALGLKSEVNRSVNYAAVFHILVLIPLVFFEKISGPVVATLLVATETIVFLFRIRAVKYKVVEIHNDR